MSNAITRARELRQQADRLKNRQADEARALHFEKRRNELVELRKHLEEFALPAGVLARDGRILSDDLPESAEVEELLSKLLIKARQEAPEDFTKGNDYSRFRKRLEATSAALESLVDNVWKKFLAELPPVNEKLLDDITTIPGQEQAVRQVRQLKSELQTATVRLPRVDDELKAIFKRAEALSTKLAGLSDAHYPIPVRQFLRAAQQPGGAALGLLTDDVRQWLEARGLIDRIRLRWIEVPGGRRP
jgi:predicted  nucleic acid-binding Zn-ribbon protein